jgi:hypothetical protein
MHQEMVYYNRMHVKIRLSQSILSKIVDLFRYRFLHNPTKTQEAVGPLKSLNFS